jgi:hypothetical protein
MNGSSSTAKAFGYCSREWHEGRRAGFHYEHASLITKIGRDAFFVRTGVPDRPVNSNLDSFLPAFSGPYANGLLDGEQKHFSIVDS